MKKYKKAYVEITNLCNLNCSFCPKSKREIIEMSLEKFAFVTKSVKTFSDYIYLHVQGEPTAHSQFEEIAKTAFDEGLKVCLTTNGTMLKRVRTAAENMHFHKISISLQALSGNGIFDIDEYLIEAVSFAKDMANMDSIVVFRLWNKGGEEDNNEKIIAFLEREFSCDIIQKKKLSERIFFEEAEQFSWTVDFGKEDVFCYGLKDQFGVLSNGEVIPCCLDSEGEIPLGNIFEKNLSDILSGENATKLCEGFKNRKAIFERCKKCGFARRF